MICVNFDMVFVIWKYNFSVVYYVSFVFDYRDGVEDLGFIDGVV